MKHKIFTLFFAVAASVGTMFAEKVKIDNLYYNLDATNKTAEVTSQNSRSPYWSTSLTTADIPSSVTYNEIAYSVTSIGQYAFWDCTGLTSVTIPNSVTSIGQWAFFNCTGLTSMTIPNSVTSIGNYAFSGVINIVYSGSATGSPWGALSINGYVEGFLVFNDDTKTVLLGCSSAAIGEMVIPNSVTSIGRNAFNGCIGLTSVTIPNSVTSIGGSAFSGCTGLTSVTIPNSVTSIGQYAFSSCSGLTSVTIPNSVTSIEEYTFYCCTSLTSVSIPNSIISIGNKAFSDCRGLTSFIIPESVTNIGGEAFDGCYGLTSVTCLAKNPPSMGSRVFDNVDCSQIPLYVPEESITAYQAADQWKEFDLHVAEAPTAVPEVYSDSSNPAQKFIRNGQILILRGEKVYTVTGQEVR